MPLEVDCVIVSAPVLEERRGVKEHRIDGGNQLASMTIAMAMAGELPCPAGWRRALSARAPERRKSPPSARGAVVERAPHHHYLGECLAFILHQMEIVVDHYYAVAQGDAGKGDEAHQAGDADRPCGEPDHGHRPDHRQRDVHQNAHLQPVHMEQIEQDPIHQHERCDGEQADDACGLLLCLKLTAVGDEIAGGMLTW